MKIARIVAPVVVVALSGAACAQHLMGVKSNAPEGVVLLDSANGTVVNQDWISDAFAVGWDFFTPKKALRVGDEIWVSDQVRNAIHRFELDANDPVNNGPQFVGSITGDGVNPFSNIRGMAYDGSRVYLCNFSGFYANQIIVIDTATQAVVNSFQVSSGPFDVEVYGEDLIVVSSGTPHVVRYSKTGANLGVLVQSGLSTPQGVHVESTDRIWVANSLGNDRGLYRYDGAGNLQESILTLGPIGSQAVRGVWTFDNGDLAASTAGGLFRVVPDGFGGHNFVPLLDGSIFNGQYVTGVDLVGGPACPPDLNGDGVVDADDFFLFLQLFAAGDMRADFNNDGVIDADDFFAFLNAFAQGC